MHSISSTYRCGGHNENWKVGRLDSFRLPTKIESVSILLRQKSQQRFSYSVWNVRCGTGNDKHKENEGSWNPERAVELWRFPNWRNVTQWGTRLRKQFLQNSIRQHRRQNPLIEKSKCARITQYIHFSIFSSRRKSHFNNRFRVRVKQWLQVPNVHKWTPWTSSCLAGWGRTW